MAVTITLSEATGRGKFLANAAGTSVEFVAENGTAKDSNNTVEVASCDADSTTLTVKSGTNIALAIVGGTFDAATTKTVSGLKTGDSLDATATNLTVTISSAAAGVTYKLDNESVTAQAGDSITLTGAGKVTLPALTGDQKVTVNNKEYTLASGTVTVDKDNTATIPQGGKVTVGGTEYAATTTKTGVTVDKDGIATLATGDVYQTASNFQLERKIPNDASERCVVGDFSSL